MPSRPSSHAFANKAAPLGGQNTLLVAPSGSPIGGCPFYLACARLGTGVTARESTMKEDVFNTSIRKLLKEFGVTAQHEIEKAVRQAVLNIS